MHKTTAVLLQLTSFSDREDSMIRIKKMARLHYCVMTCRLVL